jgi:hypothetical protein
VSKVRRSFNRYAVSIGFALELALVLLIAVATSVCAREQTEVGAPTSAAVQKTDNSEIIVGKQSRDEQMKHSSLDQQTHAAPQNWSLQASVTLVSIDYRATDADASKRFFAGPLRAGSNEPIVVMPPQQLIPGTKIYKAEAVLDEPSPSAPAPLSVFTLRDILSIETSAEPEGLSTRVLSPPELPPLFSETSSTMVSASAIKPADASSAMRGSSGALETEKAPVKPSPVVIAWNHALRRAAPAFVDVNDQALQSLDVGWNAWYRRVGESIIAEFDRSTRRPAQFELNFHILNSGSLCVSFISGQCVDSDGHLEEGYGPFAAEVMQRVTTALANNPILTFPKGTHRSGVIFQMLLRKSQDGVIGYSPGNTIDGELGTPLSF